MLTKFFFLTFLLVFSWGTKGDNSIDKDLGVVRVSDEKEKGIKTVEIELPADQYDINCQYDSALFALDAKPSKSEVYDN
jgi:chitin synthase